MVFDRDMAADTSIIDVRTGDQVGVLYTITRAIAELDLDIRQAKVQTLGHEVVDSFYLRGPDGQLDDGLEHELHLAVRHALASAADQPDLPDTRSSK